MTDWPNILKTIHRNAGISLDIRSIKSVSGGCINACYMASSKTQNIFLKTNQARYLNMFEAEAAGLRSMAAANAIRVPESLYTGRQGETAFIVMQAIKMGRETAASYVSFGRQLAAMHRYRKPRFGADVDNTIGSTPQVNTRSNNWFDFWRIHRLGYQLKLAAQNHAPPALIEDGLHLNDTFEGLFDRAPEVSCLHGDLWQGNWGFTDDGQAVIFDPAHYFGDRETDIAMTRLFGGAPESFYAAYREAYPLQSGHTTRETFYNIYHILNHFNLFGGGYAHQAHRMIQNVLSELR